MMSSIKEAVDRPEIREDLIKKKLNQATSMLDLDIQDNIEKRSEFIKRQIDNDEELTEDEKRKAKNVFRDYEYYKVLSNEGEKRFCGNCQNECLAISYCEHCVRNFVKTDFSTSGNDNIDNLIRKCQMGVISPKK